MVQIICQKHKKIIIIEDDCVPFRNFLNFLIFHLE